MQTYVYNRSHVRGLTPNPPVPIPDGLPFVLDDEMRPVEDLNAWLRSLRGRGCHSPRTWTGYADDVLAWARFLQSRDRWLFDDLDSLKDAVSDYREVRLQGDADEVFQVVGASAWNRAVSAMENFYGWAVEVGKISAPPFNYKVLRLPRYQRSSDTLKLNLARAKPGSPLATLRHLDGDYADMFIAVGLGGATPTGQPDDDFRGRLATRNRAMGELVRRSGLRRQEFSNLLVWEVPQPAGPFQDHISLPVPQKIAKGARARTTWITSTALEAVTDYVSLERPLHTDGSSWMPQRPLMVTDATRDGGTINGRWVRWSHLTIPQRRRLVAPDGGSGLLFVRSTGAPVSESNWRYTFNTAADRCRQFDTDFPTVTPHMLRHTFAVETLNELTRGALARAERLAELSGADPLLIAILRRKDPLLILRDLLGHRSLQTTEVYLALQDPARILTDAEIERLAEEEDFDAADLAGAS
ncbi:tyrosine-type recombinase/integrase [Georgenia yuyongxinii]|uniref:Tyrosine-type recombinase/integrase n=1 Tax=Georgenia yuyongxinii TaxID=2589797 RepID=A0A552WNP4_9MICO|nr:tyrosine-type recombinase/integrase [Georgenia yuyongxinii]TRW44391.1 tyrosine-type recombinase/integrase [Georgenia yuyongxinii]